VGVDRGAADRPLVELELTHGVQHFTRCRHDFRPDAVAGKYRYALAHRSLLYVR